MDLRHQFIAHRGETENEIGISYMLVPKKDAVEKAQIRFSQLKQISFSGEDLIRIESLVNFVLEKLQEKIEKSGQKVYEGMFNLYSAEQLSLMMINNAK